MIPDLIYLPTGVQARRLRGRVPSAEWPYRRGSARTDDPLVAIRSRERRHGDVGRGDKETGPPGPPRGRRGRSGRGRRAGSRSTDEGPWRRSRPGEDRRGQLGDAGNHRLQHRSGILSIGANKYFAKIPGIALTAGTFVIATLLQYRSGVWVAAAVPNAGADSITIYLNKKVTSAVKVGWIALEKFPPV